MAALTSLLYVTLLALSSPMPCGACSCLRDPEEPLARAVPREFDDAAAVFAGRVLGSSSPTLDEALAGAEPFVLRVQILVERRWKGVSDADTVVVTTSGQSSMCGADLRPGRRYLVYASRSDAGPLTTSWCSRTAEIRRVRREEIRLLDRMRVSAAPRSPDAAADVPHGIRPMTSRDDPPR